MCVSFLGVFKLTHLTRSPLDPVQSLWRYQNLIVNGLTFFILKLHEKCQIILNRKKLDRGNKILLMMVLSNFNDTLKNIHNKEFYRSLIMLK